jgi:hypothetical protein
MLRQRWLEVLRAEVLRREEEEGGALREQRIAVFEAELREIAERLALSDLPLLEDASIAQRLAVLMYLPHRLSAAEQETEAAALDAWFEDRFGKGRG